MGNNDITQNNTGRSNKQDNLTYNIMQLVIFIIMVGLIIFRIINYQIQSNSWIWIVNYIGMSIAFVNLFLNKCFDLKNRHNKKYKPFVGFTICMLIIVIIISFPIYKLQISIYSQTVNDIITLFALFFSLSHVIWDSILNIIVKFIKR